MNLVIPEAQWVQRCAARLSTVLLGVTADEAVMMAEILYDPRLKPEQAADDLLNGVGP